MVRISCCRISQRLRDLSITKNPHRPTTSPRIIVRNEGKNRSSDNRALASRAKEQCRFAERRFAASDSNLEACLTEAINNASIECRGCRFIQQDKEIVSPRKPPPSSSVHGGSRPRHEVITFPKPDACDVSKIGPDARMKMIDETRSFRSSSSSSSATRRGSISAAARYAHSGVSSFVEFLWTPRELFRARRERRRKRERYARESRNQVPWNINAIARSAISKSVCRIILSCKFCRASCLTRVL